MDGVNFTPFLKDAESGKSYELKERLITIGSAAESSIQLAPSFPKRCAHLIFLDGHYCFQALTEDISVKVNDSPVSKKTTLHNGDRIRIGKALFFFNEEGEVSINAKSTADSVDELLNMVLMLLRDRDGDISSALMAAIARLLRCDAARIVGEDPAGLRRTLVRYPEHAGLDRFSNRAIDWARQASQAVLLHETDWADLPADNRSLEKNAVSSVICAPLRCGNQLNGYLYLDRIKKNESFTESDRKFCERLLPLFTELLANSEERRRLADTIAALQETQEKVGGGIIYRSEVVRSIISFSDRIATTDAPVLISGETGTGKELLARYIHSRSLRSEKPFKAVNCGAIPENLIESELFGHEKGAFTGAHTRKIGLFEAANTGTVFLDEIGEMQTALQVKLLRVIQEAEVVRVGSTDPVKVDVRIIAATNRDLREEIEKGRFRQDLFFRLNVLSINLPPLRDRREDILLLAEYFIGKHSSRIGRERKPLSAEAQSILLAYHWPGNIRELENVIQKAVIISSGKRIEKNDLDLNQYPDKPEAAGFFRPQALKAAREAAERQCIREGLKAAMGNISQASRLLEIDRKWLLAKMREYGIDAQEYRSGTG